MQSFMRIIKLVSPKHDENGSRKSDVEKPRNKHSLVNCDKSPFEKLLNHEGISTDTCINYKRNLHFKILRFQLKTEAEETEISLEWRRSKSGE